MNVHCTSIQISSLHAFSTTDMTNIKKEKKIINYQAKEMKGVMKIEGPILNNFNIRSNTLMVSQVRATNCDAMQKLGESKKTELAI